MGAESRAPLDHLNVGVPKNLKFKNLNCALKHLTLKNLYELGGKEV